MGSVFSGRSLPQCDYRKPKRLNSISESHVSKYIAAFVQKATSKIPFPIQCVEKYNRLYNWGARTFWWIVHREDITEFDWAEVVGSFSENSCITGSDVDFLQVRGMVFADESDIEPGRLFGLCVVTDIDLIPPGCCWLRRFRNKNEREVEPKQYFQCYATKIDGHTHYAHHNNMDKIVCFRGGLIRGPDYNLYFSSKAFSDYCGRQGLTTYKFINRFLPQWNAHGPAFTQTYFNQFTVDVAHCFRCEKGWPECAAEWKTRSRDHGWPPEALINDILVSGFDVVSIPSKVTMSETADLEWRISFRKAETKLIKSFNDTQRTCFLLLKVIVKQYIEPMFPGEDIVSTYTIKTLAFWVLETTPRSYWSSENLLFCFRICINKLVEWILDGYCPNYFIPTYNLFRTKLQDMEETRFRERLSKELLERDWAVLLECDFFKNLNKMWKRSNRNETVFTDMIKQKMGV